MRAPILLAFRAKSALMGRWANLAKKEKTLLVLVILSIKHLLSSLQLTTIAKGPLELGVCILCIGLIKTCDLKRTND